MFHYQGEGIGIYVNPLLHYQLGNDSQTGSLLHINSRGLLIEGTIDNKVSFQTTLTENQLRHPSYVRDFQQEFGVIPGIGGTQRLTKMIGKTKAMDWILTGRMIDAMEAERSGLVARIFSSEELLEKTLEIAAQIASYSKTTVMIARETVGRAMELGLREGILFERRVFHALFDTKDQKEGMSAFIDKRPPNYNIDQKQFLLSALNLI